VWGLDDLGIKAQFLAGGEKRLVFSAELPNHFGEAGS
jgi:hypothetical protein